MYVDDSKTSQAKTIFPDSIEPQLIIVYLPAHSTLAALTTVIPSVSTVAPLGATEATATGLVNSTLVRVRLAVGIGGPLGSG